jgi:hypothetical protein
VAVETKYITNEYVSNIIKCFGLDTVVVNNAGSGPVKEPFD